MRNLTVKREKRYVGCLAKVHLYIEDPTSNDIVINQVKCRKLGELKNGEEKSFEIEDHELKIFAIIDKLSKSYCNDYYKLPAGYEDVSLQGKCAFNSVGNAFLFDGVTDEEILQNRKKNKKKGAMIGILAVIVGFLIGFCSVYYFDSAPSPQTFSSNGVKITLTDEFVKVPMDSFTVCYGNDDVAVFFLEERFDVYEGLEEYTLTEYGEGVIEVNNYDPSTQLKDKDDLKYFEYEATNPDTGDEYSYIAFVYETSEAFWLVQFGVLTENMENYYQSIFDWAKTVEFAK